MKTPIADLAIGLVCCSASIVISMQLCIMWEEYVAPHIRSWRYERKMEKARQAFLRGLEKEVERARSAEIKKEEK